MNVLAIGAHADDIELGLGGAIAKHTAHGDHVHILIVTHSGYESYEGTVIREKHVALQEARAAAKILGVEKLTCLNYETKHVKYDVRLIEDLNKAIDAHEADIIYTHWDGDINQDHSAIAKATIVAARNIPRVLMYRSNWYKSVKPFDGNHYVDITDHVEAKINSIKAHKSEVAKRGPNWADFFKHQTRLFGIEVGVEHAELFKAIKWLN